MDDSRFIPDVPEHNHELTLLNKKLVAVELKMGGLESKLDLIHETLNGFINERGIISRLENVEKDLKIIERDLKLTNMKIEASLGLDDPVLLARLIATLERVEEKIIRD